MNFALNLTNSAHSNLTNDYVFLFNNFSSSSQPITTNFHYALWQKILFSCFMFPIIILSIVGNIIVIVAIIKYDYLRITNNFFLASLAVADCAVGILAMPPNALQLLTGRWYLKAFMCRFWLACDMLFSTSSIMHLCCVSFDRFLSISDKYTFNYHAQRGRISWRVRIMIAGVWIISVLLSFGPIYTNVFTTREHAEEIDRLDFENGQCTLVVNLPFRFISSIVSFWLPGFGMILFYSLVYRKAQKLSKNDTFLKQKRNSEPNSSTMPKQRASFEKSWRSEYKVIYF
jgi:hypothetical protein